MTHRANLPHPRCAAIAHQEEARALDPHAQRYVRRELASVARRDIGAGSGNESVEVLNGLAPVEHAGQDVEVKRLVSDVNLLRNDRVALKVVVALLVVLPSALLKTLSCWCSMR